MDSMKNDTKVKSWKAMCASWVAENGIKMKTS